MLSAIPDSAFAAWIEVGLAAIERGDFVEHEEVIARIDAMIARQEERCG